MTISFYTELIFIIQSIIWLLFYFYSPFCTCIVCLRTQKCLQIKSIEIVGEFKKSSGEIKIVSYWRFWDHWFFHQHFLIVFIACMLRILGETWSVKTFVYVHTTHAIHAKIPKWSMQAKHNITNWMALTYRFCTLVLKTDWW